MAQLNTLPGIEAAGANRYLPLRDRQYSNKHGAAQQWQTIIGVAGDVILALGAARVDPLSTLRTE